MPGKRDRNLRSGDLAEGLALLAFREFSAVAPFPREEDFGIDAMCTLIREEGRALIPENTFAIQIKACSVREIELDQGQLHWLASVDVPFFHVLVDRQTTSLELYTYEWIHALHFEGAATFTVDRPDDAAFFQAQPGLISFKPARAWLGPPILRLSLSELVERDGRRKVYSLLKIWCDIVASIIRVREHNMYPKYRWNTGEAPSLHGSSLFATCTDEELARIFRDLLPLLHKLELSLGASKPGAEFFPEIQALGHKAKSLGVDVPFPLHPSLRVPKG